MNEIENMNFSDLIYKFIDGDTNEMEQTILFNSLSNDSQLQQEFQQAISIQQGFEFDKSVLAPSVNLTNTVFAKAGFTSAINNVPKFTMLSSLIKPAVFTLFGIILTVGYFLINASNPTENNKLNAIPKKNLAMNIPVEQINKHNFKSIKIINPSQKLNFVKSQNEQKNISNVEIINPTPKIEFNSKNFSSNQISADSYHVNIEDNRFGGIIEVKGISSLAYLPDRTILPQESGIGNNISLSLMKKINEHNSAGLIIGKEDLQLYAVKQFNGDYNFELRPNLFWIGALYRYSGEEIYGPVRPYADIIIAGTKYGPLGKLTLGIVYNPQDFISMSLGLESTALMYKYLGNYNFTEKFSVIYGLGIHF